MNRTLLLAFVASLFCVFACTEVSPEITIPQDTYSIDADGGELSLLMSSNVSLALRPSVDWIKIVAVSDGSCLVRVSANPDYNSRTGSIVFTHAESSLSKEIYIQQREQEALLDVYNGLQEYPDVYPILSEEETVIQSALPSSEEDCPTTEYSEDHLLQLDSIARDFLERNHLLTKASGDVNQVNKLNGYIVENIVWDAGDWGASHWAGDKIICGFNADYNKKGEKIISVILYREDGFQAGNVYLKLGTLNSGKPLCKIEISAGQKYVAMDYNIDNEEILDGNKNVSVKLLPGYGILDLFPLIVYSNGYREYLNPIIIKSDPIVPDGWDSKKNRLGYLFGTVNGVPVLHNGTSVNDKNVTRYNISSGVYQCVELCKRYLTSHYDLIRKISDTWGNANQWPDNRANDKCDSYIVLENNGNNQIREGDMIVFEYDDIKKYPYGHIGVVIKTLNTPKDNYISYAHQNGGISKRPIGATNKRNGNYITKEGSRSVTYFIRKYNPNEFANNIQYEKPDLNAKPSMTLSPETVQFGTVTVGDSRVEKFTITNKGTGTLVISSITPPEGYSCQKSSGTVASKGGQLTVTVRFDPQVVKKYHGECILQTNLGEKTIRFTGEGTEAAEAAISANPSTVMFDDTVVGEQSETIIDIINNGKAQLDISSITCPEGFSSDFVSWNSKQVRANGRQALKLYFKPTVVKSYSGNIVIKSNASNQPSLSIPVSGKGINPPDQTIHVTGVSLDKTQLNLTVGDQYTLHATVNPSNATNKGVQWKSSNTAVATVNNGIVTARATGQAIVYVTTMDGGYQASCVVTVTEKTVSVTGVSLDKTELTLTQGGQYTLHATVTPSNATNQNVKWKSTNTAVTTVENGLVKAIAPGQANIIVVTEDGSFTASCLVTVQAQSIAVTGVYLDKTELTMTVDGRYTLHASISPSNATNKNIRWKSTNPSVAKVENGVVTAVAPGQADIIVTTEDGGFTASCHVTVQTQTVAVTGVSLDKTELTLSVGDQYALHATVNPSNATNQNVKWKSTNTAAATVENGFVKAIAPGQASIIVVTEDGSFTASCLVTVQAINGGHEGTGGDEWNL